MSSDIGRILKGALRGALIGGGVGAGVGGGIPAAYHMSKGNLNMDTLDSSARFGLITAIPGALIGALLATPGNRDQLSTPISEQDKQELLYKDLIEFYNKNPEVQFTENGFRQMYQ